MSTIVSCGWSVGELTSINAWEERINWQCAIQLVWSFLPPFCGNIVFDKEPLDLRRRLGGACRLAVRPLSVTHWLPCSNWAFPCFPFQVGELLPAQAAVQGVGGGDGSYPDSCTMRRDNSFLRILICRWERSSLGKLLSKVSVAEMERAGSSKRLPLLANVNSTDLAAIDDSANGGGKSMLRIHPHHIVMVRLQAHFSIHRDCLDRAREVRCLPVLMHIGNTGAWLGPWST